MSATARNLLFIFSDQHAQAVAGCYGDSHVQTPALDGLAARGVRFDNAYCASPICVPSRMSMLTASHPSKQDCWTNDDYLSSEIPTWLHAMGAAGHYPELIGRMHAMGPDQMHGYAHREVGDHSPNWGGIPRHDMGVLNDTNDPQGHSLVACGAGQSAYEVKDRDVTNAALGALERIAKEERPFCLTVGLMLPHAPYVASRHWVDYYMQELDPPAIPPGVDEHPWISWWRENRGIGSVPERQSRLARAAYWGLVSTMDEMIGRILDKLRETGLEQDTLVVYASDHGDHVGERGLWWKHMLFDESTKVPLIMALPGVLPESESRDEVVGLIDVAQTMIEALGGTPLPQADGRSFWPILTGQHEAWDNTVFSEYCTDEVPAWTGGRAVQQRMVRRGAWKLHVYSKYPPLLFNLDDDPQELNDLSRDPTHAAVLKEMMALVLNDWDPELIRQRMLDRRQRKDLLSAWAGNVLPKSTHHWSLEPAMNRLEDVS